MMSGATQKWFDKLIMDIAPDTVFLRSCLKDREAVLEAELEDVICNVDTRGHGKLCNSLIDDTLYPSNRKQQLNFIKAQTQKRT